LDVDFPFSVPAGIKAQVAITIPENTEPGRKPKSFRGILKGRGISLERFREMQREDKAVEDAVDERRNSDAR
jgi:cytidylate kinase